MEPNRRSQRQGPISPPGGTAQRQWISLRAAYATVLSAWENELGVQGPSALIFDPDDPDQSALPSRQDLIRSIASLPDGQIDPGGDKADLTRAGLQLSMLAEAKAHLELLDALQLGLLTARARYSRVSRGRTYGQPSDPRALPAAFWREEAGVEVRPGGGYVSAGIVPDYQKSRVGPILDLATEIDLHDGFIEVDANDLHAVVSENHQFLLGAADAGAGIGGRFKFQHGKWFISIGSASVQIGHRKGLDELYVLLALPNRPIRWDALQTAAEKVAEIGRAPGLAVDLAAESVRALVDSRRAAQFVDPGMLAAAKRDIEAMERRASHVAPERAAHYLRKAQAARAFLERCTTQRRTGRSSYWVMRDAQYHRLARALDHLASAIPPIIGHLGTLRLLDRRALVLGERTVMYAPEGRVSWDLSYLPLPRPLDLDELDL